MNITKTKLKRRLLILIAIVAVFFSILSSQLVLDTSANENSESKYNNDVDSFLEGTEEPEDILNKIMESLDENNDDVELDSINYAVKRLFQPGRYINDVSSGVIDGDLGSKGDFLYDSKHACNPNEPNNLLNHNCNIPNFTTELIQNISAPFYSPFDNGNKTSAKSIIGIPVGIKKEGVPVNRETSGKTYTALEMYGYDLKLTTYKGEWDKVTVSTRSRMLSNFGFFDHTKLVGTTLFASSRDGFYALLSSFNFRDDRFLRPISSTWKAMTGSGINVLLDTTELNVIATREWKREQLNGTLYNVYVLSDKEVLDETSGSFFTKWIARMKELMNSHPELKKVEQLSPTNIPEFNFVEEMERPESIQLRLEIEEFNKNEEIKKQKSDDAIEKYNKDISDGMIIDMLPLIPYEMKKKEVPEPVYYTRDEQFKELWALKNSEYLNLARSENLIPVDVNELSNYEEMSTLWATNWEPYKNRKFDENGDIIQELATSTDNKIYSDNIYMNTRQAISHYACANEDGTPMRKSNGELEYLYLDNNKGSTENLNPKCKAARSPIGGGFLGDGWHVDRGLDTRHRLNVDSNDEGFILFKGVHGALRSAFRSINSFVAKITNLVLGLSFSPILSSLGVDVIISTLVEGFRDTIFFPMSTLAAAVGGILIFIQLLKNGSAVQLLMGIFGTFLIFIIGAMFLIKPEYTLKLADEWPSAADNFIADIILGKDNGSTYCSTGESKNGIRSAQCNVWGTMVFNPWVQLQFGTGYNNLYAKGFAPSGANEMKNSDANAALVGNAEVNMGGGVTVNNWAMYQLSKTKTGSITTSSNTNEEGIGKVDKDLYRLVDLQAGPNNGEGTDSRFFSAWSGGTGSAGTGGIALITTIQAVVISIAIIGLGFKKIESSFIFSIMLVFLPIMLLYALLPKGKEKLKGYLGTLTSLFIKRIMVTILLSTYLAMLSGVGASMVDLKTSALTSIILSIVFIMYKNELLDLLTASEGSEEIKEQIKEAASNTIPRDLKNRYATTKAQVRGQAFGALGGLAGATQFNMSNSIRLDRIQDRIVQLERVSEKGLLTPEELDELDKLRVENEELEKTIADNKANNTGGLMRSMRDGSEASKGIIGRRQELRVRRSGHGAGQIIAGAKENVINEGSRKIEENIDPIEQDVFRDLVSTGDTRQNTMTSTEALDKENARMLRNPRVQRIVREEAAKRREKLKADKEQDAVSKDDLDMDKLRDVIESRRELNRNKDKVFNMKDEYQRIKNKENSKDSSNITSDTEEIRDQIIKARGEALRQKEELSNRHSVSRAEFDEWARHNPERASEIIEEERLSHKVVISTDETNKKGDE